MLLRIWLDDVEQKGVVAFDTVNGYVIRERRTRKGHPVIHGDSYAVERVTGKVEATGQIMSMPSTYIAPHGGRPIA